MRKSVFEMDADENVDKFLACRPPTGLQLNPLQHERMNIRYDSKGNPMQRTLLGQPSQFQVAEQKRK
jgi:hypothetical protein